MNGSIHKRKWTAADGTERESWRVRYLDPNGQRQSKSFARKHEAERFLLEQASRVVRGDWIDPTDGDVPFGEYFVDWCSRQVWRPSTAEQVASHTKNHIAPHLGHYRLHQLRKSVIQSWVKTLSTRLAPSTVEVIYLYVASSLRGAVEDQMLTRTPCSGITLPKKMPVMIVPLPTEQVLALADAIDHRYRALVMVAAGTGVRQGEAFALTNIDRVRFMERKVVVDRQILLARGGARFGPPKTSASVREIPLPRSIQLELASHVEAFEVSAGGLLFVDDRNGGPMRRNRFSERIWQPAIAAAGLPEGTGFHALRHYYASLLIRHGESVTTVQHRLGHASATETLNTYAHLWPDSDERTRAAVDEVFDAEADDADENGTEPP